jgi:hypothetical protein
MPPKMEDPILNAIKTNDANGLRRLAATARNPDQRMLLLLLAEIIDRVQSNIRQRRRFPFVGIRVGHKAA